MKTFREIQVMKNRWLHALAAFLLCILCSLVPCSFSAAQTSDDVAAWSEQTGIYISSDGTSHVYDVAGLLSSDNVSELERLAKEYGAKQNLDYYILLTDELDGVTVPTDESSRRSATESLGEEFYTTLQASGVQPESCAVLTIFYPGVEGQNYVDISVHGIIENKGQLNNSRRNQVIDKMISDLKDGDLYNACIIYLKTVDRYIKINPGMNPEFFLFKLPFQLLIGFVIALIITLIMVHNSGGKVTVTQSTYLDSRSPGVIGRYDRFVRKTTTKRKIETSSGGGHSSGGGGGGNHSGRSF